MGQSNAGNGSERPTIRCQAVCGHQRGQKDRPDPLLDAETEQDLQHRDEKHGHEELPNLDADIERQQGRHQVRPGELKRFSENARTITSVGTSWAAALPGSTSTKAVTAMASRQGVRTQGLRNPGNRGPAR